MERHLTERHAKDITALRGCVGHALVSIVRTRYLFNGQPDSDGDGDVELRFEGDKAVVLTLDSDGESVHAEQRELSLPPAFELDDGSRCAWDTVKVSDSTPFHIFVGATLKRADAMVDQWKEGGHEALAGWVLHFGDDVLTFVNQGDESRLDCAMPPSDPRIDTTLENLSGIVGAG